MHVCKVTIATRISALIVELPLFSPTRNLKRSKANHKERVKMKSRRRFKSIKNSQR